MSNSDKEFNMLLDDNVIEIKTKYVEMTGDIVVGLVLNEIVDYFIHTAERFFIEKEDKKWMVRTKDEWNEDCMITNKQLDQSLKVLRNKGIIETKIFRYHGYLLTHINLNTDVFMDLLNKLYEDEISKKSV